VAVYLTDVNEQTRPRRAHRSLRPRSKPCRPSPARSSPAAIDPVAEDFAALKATLKAGVKIAVAPQLFPTPPALAARMATFAGIEYKDRVLEPSAGTGNLLRAIVDAEPTASVHAVEINRALCDACRPVSWPPGRPSARTS